MGSGRRPESGKSGFGGQSSKMNDFGKEFEKKLIGSGRRPESGNRDLEARAPKSMIFKNNLKEN